MKKKGRKVEKFLHGNRQAIQDLVKELVEVPSESGSERRIESVVADTMEELGYDEILKDETGNVVGKIGGGPRVILFDAHMDTVPVGDKSDWDTGPFEGRVKDGRLFGRGACDDKGPLAALLFAGKTIKELGLAENFTVYVSSSVMEETCEGVALGNFLEESGVEPDFAVVAEASELRITRGHRGRALIQAKFDGKPVHASNHEDSNHAIYKANEFIGGVKQLDDDLPEDPVLGEGDVCVTKVEVDTNSLNSTPSECRVFMDRRTTTLDSRESILEEIQTLPGAGEAEIEIKTFEGRTHKNEEIKSEEYYPAWVLEEDHELIDAGRESYRDYFGEDLSVGVWGFSTNGNYTMGKENIPTIGFGPGNPKYCHGPDERINLEEVIQATGFYALLPHHLEGK